MSLLIITYGYINSLTVCSTNRHPVRTGCLLSGTVLLGHLDPWIWDWLVIPKCWNGITTFWWV